MTYVLVQPQMIAVAAADVAGLRSVIDQANATAAAPTTGVVAAAGDEVSAATAALFSTYAQEYQAVLKQAEAFHDGFAQLLATAGNAYAEAEAAASGTLGAVATQGEALLAPLTGSGTTGVVTATQAAMTDPPVAISLILGASGTPTPSQQYVTAAYNNYISRNFTTSNLQVLSTPEGLYPVTGIKELTLQISVARGLTILNNALLGPSGQITLGNTPVNVFGYSQGAILAALELPQLSAAGVPTSAVNFVLVGNELTPNGGSLARFPGLYFPSLGLPFYGGMSANTGYAVENYTLEYDGFADFPQYPIDFLSDLNAVAGIAVVHGTYLTIPQAQINSAIILPTTPGYNGGTTYYLIPTQNLPLLAPLRSIPYIGQPIADLVQPDLSYLVNWGYGDPNYGYSTGPANVTTPFGLFPPLSATTALGPDLISGTQQGIVAAMADVHAEIPSSLPTMPPAFPQLSPSGITGALSTPAVPTGVSPVTALSGAIESLETANTNISDALASTVSTAYAPLLPTADIATALVTTIPSYDTNLFLNGILQAINGDPVGGLINAIGDPIAADVALGTVAGGFELIIFVRAATTILTGAQYPMP